MDAKSPHFGMLERYTVLVCNKSSTMEHVDEFCCENKAVENIPSTSDALLQHVKRATYQASVWATNHNSQQERPTPESWGWKWDVCGKE